jgi:hypothetical protein
MFTAHLQLTENVNAEQKARLLEGRVVENMETIDQLRQERALLAADHKELEHRFSEISEVRCSGNLSVKDL